MAREIVVGSLVQVPDRKVGEVNRVMPRLRLQMGQQLRVTAIINRNTYKRKCYQVIARPGDDPFLLWGTQVKLVSSKVDPAEIWKAAA